MIPLHRPWLGQAEEDAVVRVLRRGHLAGNGQECATLESELGQCLGIAPPLVVSSATHALEMAMHLLPARGGEIIVPSFTFPSAPNAVLAAGGRVRFCDIREPDLNVDLDHARSLVGSDTRALIVTHYAGHPQRFAGFPVPVIEDAAHALGSRLGDRPCGALGVFGCFSFHHTKNVPAGEGGALLVADPDRARAARIYREKGTNRDDFMAGRTSAYTWVGQGSSVVMPELSAAVARVQLSKMEDILRRRRRVARLYDHGLAERERQGALKVVRPVDDGDSSHHIYAVLVEPTHRTPILRHMREAGVQAASHFVPLHSSPYGRMVASTSDLPTTDRLAASIIRLPIYPDLAESEVERVIGALLGALDAPQRRG